MLCASDCPGSFPAKGPVTYLPLSPEEVQASMTESAPAERTWFHATNERAARAICRQGLIPSCWTGGDSCCVFGYNEVSQIPVYRGEWVLEVRSHALESQLKAWWVPAGAIRGVWRNGKFYSAATLRATLGVLAEPPGGCACELSSITEGQIALWRGSWL